MLRVWILEADLINVCGEHVFCVKKVTVLVSDFNKIFSLFPTGFDMKKNKQGGSEFYCNDEAEKTGHAITAHGCSSCSPVTDHHQK